MRGSCLVLLGLLVGCQDGFSVNASAETFCDEYAEVVCHNMYQCCTEAQIEAELGVDEPRTEQQCRVDKKRTCERATVSVRDSLKAGRVTFNPDAFNNCLSAMVAPSDTCSEYVMKNPFDEACEESPWVGTVAMGGTCYFDHDCAGAPRSAECGPDQKCVALPTGGFPCPNGTCAEGFFCGTNAICESRLAENAPCTSNGQCQEDLFCDLTATPTPICTARKGGGEACTSNAACESGECVPGRCMGTNLTCYTDAQCGGRCADTNSTCTVGFDYLCNPTGGFCNVVTSVPCSGSTADSQCLAAEAGDKCIFNVACVPGDCVGDPVCTAPLFLTDYCAIGLGLSP